MEAYSTICENSKKVEATSQETYVHGIVKKIWRGTPRASATCKCPVGMSFIRRGKKIEQFFSIEIYINQQILILCTVELKTYNLTLTIMYDRDTKLTLSTFKGSATI